MLLLTIACQPCGRAQGKNLNIFLTSGRELENVSLLKVRNDSVVVRTPTGLEVIAMEPIARVVVPSSAFSGALGGVLAGGMATVGISELLQNGSSNNFNVPLVLGGAAIGCLAEISLAHKPSTSYDFASSPLVEKEDVLRSLVRTSTPTAQEDLWISPLAESLAATGWNVEGLRKPFVTRPLEGRVSVGLSLPVGDFGDNSPQRNGVSSAEPGVMINGDLVLSFDQDVNVLFSAAVGINGFDSRGLGLPYGFTTNEGYWTTILPLAGLEFTTDPEKKLVGSAIIQAGALIGSSPHLTLTTTSTLVDQESAEAVSVAFRAGFGIEFERKVSLELRYLYGEPSYHADATLDGQKGEATWDQPTSMFVFALGWRVF
jgi:hypothetical protein